MTRWAHTHSIPLRRGAASQTATHLADKRAVRAPAILRDALTSAYASDRLERFMAALPYPTMRDAAQAFGTSPFTLVAQVNQLEKDLGHLLIQRAARGRAMRPTELGTKIAEAVRAMKLHGEVSARS